jgi:type IV pilus modification protein PilV
MNSMRCHQQGFSILEALAALMVLNLLCLGLMAWQWQAFQVQRQALAVQQAVAMAQDLSDRMQVHPGAWRWYQLGLNESPPSADCNVSACNAQQWAQADMSQWLSEWRQRLPQARAQVQTMLSDQPQVELLLVWPGVSDNTNPGVANCPPAQNCWSTTWRL